MRQEWVLRHAFDTFVFAAGWAHVNVFSTQIDNFMACGTLELEQGDVFMKNLGMLLAVFLSVFQIQCARAPHYIDDVHRLNKTR